MIYYSKIILVLSYFTYECYVLNMYLMVTLIHHISLISIIHTKIRPIFFFKSRTLFQYKGVDGYFLHKKNKPFSSLYFLTLNTKYLGFQNHNLK